MSGAAAIKLPPFSGSPSHHSPLRVKLPILTNPTGADTSHCNSNSPMLFTESNASVTVPPGANIDRKSTRLNSSHRCISYAVFCLKKTLLPCAIFQSRHGRATSPQPARKARVRCHCARPVHENPFAYFFMAREDQEHHPPSLAPAFPP